VACCGCRGGCAGNCGEADGEGAGSNEEAGDDVSEGGDPSASTWAVRRGAATGVHAPALAGRPLVAERGRRIRGPCSTATMPPPPASAFSPAVSPRAAGGWVTGSEGDDAVASATLAGLAAAGDAVNRGE